jgi:outer membrane immunogenic protein
MSALRGGIVALAVVSGTVALTVSAVADDFRWPGYDQPYSPSPWRGLYGGAHLGWGWSGDADGVVGGGQLGYNWQSQQFVYGVEGDISAADIGVSESLPGVTASASIDWIATIRGRFGVLAQPNLLIYGTAGLAIVNWEAHGSIMGVDVLSAHGTESGFVYGVGVEKKISEGMSARLEYLGFSQPDRVGDFGVVSPGLGDFGIVRAGLNFKLGQ